MTPLWTWLSKLPKRSKMINHIKDEDCIVGADGCCKICWTCHNVPCKSCGGKGFHRENCPKPDPMKPIVHAEGDPPHKKGCPRKRKCCGNPCVRGPRFNYCEHCDEFCGKRGEIRPEDPEISEHDVKLVSKVVKGLSTSKFGCVNSVGCMCNPCRKSLKKEKI